MLTKLTAVINSQYIHYLRCTPKTNTMLYGNCISIFKNANPKPHTRLPNQKFWVLGPRNLCIQQAFWGILMHINI